HQQHDVFQSTMYASCFQPLSYSVSLPSGPLMTPKLTGKSMNWISCRGVDGLMKSRSGMNAPNGTPTKRLLSRSHAEYNGALSARSASRSRASTLSKPAEITCGGRLSSSSAMATGATIANTPSSPSSPKYDAARVSNLIRTHLSLVAGVRFAPTACQSDGIHILLSFLVGWKLIRPESAAKIANLVG